MRSNFGIDWKRRSALSFFASMVAARLWQHVSASQGALRRSMNDEMMTRRLTLRCLLIAPYLLGPAARVRSADRVPVVGAIRTSGYDPKDPSVPPILKALRELGYEDGRNLRLDVRYAEGDRARIPGIAEALVADRVDVIVAGSEPALRAAKQATSSIPIVFLAWEYDPVASGVIDSLSRPGSNVTGVSSLQAPLLGKRLELLKETLPATRRVGVFWDSFSRGQLIDVEGPALALDIQVRPIEVKSSSELSRALSRAKEETDAGLFLFSPMFFQLREKIASEAKRVKLPTAFQEAWFTAAGGLLSYGADINEAMRRVAYLIDRLLKGSRPSDLPVEQIAKLHLAVNLKTAEDLGVTIPQSVLLRADEIIR